MGNLIAFKKGTGKNLKKVMLAAHMDEIGFYVSFIDDKGFLRVQNVGGFDTRNLFSKHVTVHTESGPISGVMNPTGKPVHLAKPDERKKIPEISELSIDLGLDPKKVKKKVQVGDMVTMTQEFTKLGELYSGKCIDNRQAVWMGIKMLKKLKKPAYDIHMVFTVQEEVGLRGASTATYKIEPDIGIAVDTTLACDTPGISAESRVTELGAGIGIKVMDSASISDRGLVKEFVAIAKKNKIPYQMEVLPRGGTDAGAIQRSRTGVKTITLSLPTRYIHTVTETFNPKDLHAGLDLLVAFLEK